MASTFRKLRVAWTAGAVLAFLLPAISLGSDEVPYVPPKSPAVREKLEWFRDQKLCLMMHFGVYSILGITESWPLSTKDAFWARTDIECVRVRHLAGSASAAMLDLDGVDKTVTPLRDQWRHLHRQPDFRRAFHIPGGTNILQGEWIYHKMRWAHSRLVLLLAEERLT